MALGGACTQGDLAHIQHPSYATKAKPVQPSAGGRVTQVKRRGLCVRSGALLGQFAAREIHGTSWHDGRDGMLVDHLRDGVSEQHHILIKGLNLTLKFDTVDQVN